MGFLAKQLIIDGLNRGILVGQLRFTERNGTEWILGESDEDLPVNSTRHNVREPVHTKAVINVVHDDFYSRVASTYDLGCELFASTLRAPVAT